MFRKGRQRGHCCILLISALPIACSVNVTKQTGDEDSGVSTFPDRDVSIRSDLDTGTSIVIGGGLDSDTLGQTGNNADARVDEGSDSQTEEAAKSDTIGDSVTDTNGPTASDAKDVTVDATETDSASLPLVGTDTTAIPPLDTGDAPPPVDAGDAPALTLTPTFGFPAGGGVVMSAHYQVKLTVGTVTQQTDFVETSSYRIKLGVGSHTFQ